MADTSREKIYGVGTSERNTRLLRIKVLRAIELQRRDFLGGSGDPYVKISLQIRENRNSTIDVARTRTVPKTLNPLWNQDFIFRVDPSKHRLQFEIFDQNKLTKDEFLGMFFVELNTPIPYESAEQSMLTKDYSLLKRSVLQRVRGKATIGLAYINPSTALAREESVENENNQQPEAGFEIINHRDIPQSLTEIPLPPGWEERKDAAGRTYYVDHTTRTTTWSRPTGETATTSERPQQQVSDRHQVDDIDGNNSQTNTPPTGSSRHPATGATNAAAAAAVIAANSNTVDDLGPMPAGWQLSKTDNERMFFIDHVNKRTTWIDPRTGKPSPLPAAQREINQNGPLPAHWEVRTLPDGRVYYIDHLNKNTTWTDPRIAGPTVPYSRDYEAKYRLFRRNLPRAKPNIGNQVELHVNRKDIMETSFRAVMGIRDTEILKTRLWVIFDGERGLDYGGLSREWFLILSREIFNPYYGLFEYSAIDNYTLQVNPLSGLFNEEHIKYFRFIGRIIGMAIYHGKLLEAFFIRPFYKMLLSKPITLADMETVDREYYQSLKYIVDNDPTDLDLYFVVSEEILGELREHELKLDGQHIQVTEENKQEYIDLVINYRFVQRMATQMNALKQGIQEILPLDTIKLFDEKEVELLISGLGEINVNDWRTYTMYKGGYTPEALVIQWFWKAIGSFNTEERTRFLQFVTGTSRLPMNGFRELWGSSGPQLFTIEKWGDRTKLPRAHTCFNRIDLPPYENYQELRQKLTQAMEMSEAFEGRLLKPSWCPPNAIFGPVWTIVYLLMGIASYLIVRDGEGSVKTLTLVFYFIQLFLNWIWSPVFFVFHQIGGALVIILALFINIFICVLQFWHINSYAGMLLLPYLIWVGYASALNMSLWQLNSPYAQPPPRRPRPAVDPYEQ
ncbi:unnamed protein product [Adineta steineri]|uniref:E3 ubiquitin-protein ligase n=1 Tax=Adineta steineri TaxID=433720 RepID=A0A814YN61_9BILA|nr:unnamed protein product [Adineta steineri]CAF3682551.1 unnamed protein product [Adineta steineri]